MQEVNGFRCMRSGSEHGPLILPQHFQPGIDIAGMVFANLGRDLKISTKEGGTEFGDLLFHGVAFIAPAFASKIPIEA